MTATRKITASLAIAVLMAIFAIRPFSVSAQSITGDQSGMRAYTNATSSNDNNSDNNTVLWYDGRPYDSSGLLSGNNDLINLIVLDQLFGNNRGLFGGGLFGGGILGNRSSLSDLIILDELFRR